MLLGNSSETFSYEKSKHSIKIVIDMCVFFFITQNIEIHRYIRGYVHTLTVAKYG